MTRMKVDIRAMRSGDESLLLYLAQETLQPLAAGFGHPELYRPDELLELLGAAEVYVAESGDEVAGFIAVERDPEALEVRCLCVSPAHEAQAVAHQLVDWVEGVACAERIERLRAFVPTGDEPSQHLYRGHAFVPGPVADRPDLIVLEKRLRADA
jgi:ribosomal protein S18 acetylase RimI-like enzyme